MDLINALGELNKAIKYTRFITCADISYSSSTAIWELYGKTPPPAKTIILKAGHDITDYHQFLEELNFEYDSGYGSQELFGTVWLDDGNWLTRTEYDGSEAWCLHKRPQIPDHLI